MSDKRHYEPDLSTSREEETALASLGQKVPFLDLSASHLELEEELVAMFRRALKTADFIGGSMVDGFEKDFAAFCETNYCVGAGNGTDALRFALIGAGVSPGDIVVTVPNTFIATTEAISQVGATPDFVDVLEATSNMDPEKLGEYLEACCSFDKSGALIHRQKGRRVAAVVPVHLYGQPADMEPILSLAQKYGLLVIEDACQAHGAQYFSTRENGWKKAGSLGKAAAFSFYPGKNLGACGEAGAVVTNDADLAARVAMLRNHGQSRKYHHEMEGYNGRLDAIQAGILRAKLKRLPAWNQQRSELAALYGELLGETPGVRVPFVAPGTRPVWHLYVIGSTRRDALRRHLEDNGVETGLHYPVPLHRQNCYLPMQFGAGSFPVAEKAASHLLSLPMGPSLARRQVERVCSLIRRFMENGRSL
ncbi:MAG: DegT/DnrJ/EryC1/StrS family aminotransferase [Syntrophobacteraceae bacterium]|nr:DegT/DnrJ/EryC1/StrS family aminotransferase [Syntrophobacteraceae bacterium]